MSNSGFRHLVRISGADIPGDMRVTIALTHIRGISHRFAEVIVNSIENLEHSERLGYITDNMIEQIENVIQEPLKHGIPEWMLNRQKDPLTGETYQSVGAKLLLQFRQDIEAMIRIRSRRGSRHSFGLRVRGQRTKSSGRGQTSLGVSRKKL
ncbi:MAG: 30S ribosomal protein S13 [Candidatus Kariarchaeaceae archaeon]